MVDDSEDEDDASDRRTLARARGGDRKAFGLLYARHAKPVYSLVLRLSGDAAMAEDMTQEAFLKALGGLRGYRGDAPVAAWLKRLAANAWIDRYRRERRFQPLEDELLASQATHDAGSGLDALALLQRLAPPIRSVVWLHCAEGWSHGELALRFGRSESWSKSIVSRALQQLRTIAGGSAP